MYEPTDEQRHPDRIQPGAATDEYVDVGELRILRGEWCDLRVVEYPRSGGMRESTVRARYDGLSSEPSRRPVFTAAVAGPPWWAFDILGVSVRRAVPSG